MRTTSLLAFSALLSLASTPAFAGFKMLNVAFFDYSDGIGASTFKEIRNSGYEHPCWQNLGEVNGIGQAYISHPPKILDRDVLLEAVHGSKEAAIHFRDALSSAGFNGAYAFVKSADGKSAQIYGASYEFDHLFISKPFPIKADNTIDMKRMSKALCEVSKDM
jgi:hypothetical protein